MNLCNIEKKNLRVLGNGEQATVYEMDKKHALKVTQMTDPGSWIRETGTQAMLARRGLAPRVVGVALCDKTGVILMEKIGKTLQERLGGKGKCLRGMWADRLIQLLKKCIQAGVLHMDNHPDNIAFTLRGKPILIDFGFSRDVTGLSRKGQQIALLFSMWQILEHMDTDCWKSSKPITKLLEKGSRAIGIPLPFTKDSPRVDFSNILPEWPELVRALASYNAIMHLPLNDRYTSKEIDYIYDFRRMAFGIEKAVPDAVNAEKAATTKFKPSFSPAF